MQAEGRDARHGSLEPRDAGQLRISDDDRHKVAEVLRTAAGEGRIDLDELDERLEAAYAAKTYADLVPITADLPVAGTVQPVAPRPAPRPLPAVAGPRYANSLAILGESKRVGVWTIEAGHTAFTLMGSVVLDLREARFEQQEVTITATAIMGEVKVIVDAATTVLVEGTGIMGEFVEQRARVPFEPRPDAPVVHVRGFALMGSVNVQRRAMPGEGRRRLGWTR
ncbi:MAG: DUF1707 SHOCT-like domain-containing protein [Nocardioidaceae bacterium]